MEKFDLVKWLKGLIDPVTWSKSVMYLVMGAVIVFALVCVKSYFFPTKKNINKPVTTVLPFAKVDKIDNTNTQITVEKEKAFEVGVGGGVLRYDNKDGWIGGGWGKYKF
jgi:hypothetical protein